LKNQSLSVLGNPFILSFCQPYPALQLNVIPLLTMNGTTFTVAKDRSLRNIAGAKIGDSPSFTGNTAC
jgi:hypothetical protein